MVWYDVVIGLAAALGSIGGIAGVVTAIKSFMYTKQERQGKELNNKSTELDNKSTEIDNLLKIITEIRSENSALREELHDYKEEVNGYVADFKARFAAMEQDRDNFKMATMEAYRCKLPATLDDCPVVRHLKSTQICTSCEHNKDIDKQ